MHSQWRIFEFHATVDSIFSITHRTDDDRSVHQIIAIILLFTKKFISDAVKAITCMCGTITS